MKFSQTSLDRNIAYRYCLKPLRILFLVLTHHIQYRPPQPYSLLTCHHPRLALRYVSRYVCTVSVCTVVKSASHGLGSSTPSRGVSMQAAFAAFQMGGGGDSASDAALQVLHAQAIPFLVCFLIAPTLTSKKFAMFSPLTAGRSLSRRRVRSSIPRPGPVSPVFPDINPHFRLILPIIRLFDQEMSSIRRRPTSHLTHSILAQTMHASKHARSSWPPRT